MTEKQLRRALYDGNLGEDLTGIPEDLVVDDLTNDMLSEEALAWQEIM